MRYYLDTNILVFIMQGYYNELSNKVKSIIDDYGNILFTSSVCVQELIHLCQLRKVTIRKGHKDTEVDASKILPWLNEAGIEIKPITRKHLETMATLPLRKSHHDPFDRLIIAQAIADNIEIITSDHQFENYCRYGLQLTFNER